MRTSSILVVLTVLSATAGSAQEGRFELTPFVGYQFGGEIDLSDFDFGPFSLDVENDSVVGLIADIPLNGNLQVELLINHQSTELELDQGLIGPSFPLGEVDLTFYHVGILLQLNVGQVKPYIAASGGVTEIDPGLPDTDQEYRPSISIGGGVKLLLTDHLGIRVEGRAYFTDISGDDFSCCRDDSDDSLFQGALTGGVILRF